MFLHTYFPGFHPDDFPFHSLEIDKYLQHRDCCYLRECYENADKHVCDFAWKGVEEIALHNTKNQAPVEQRRVVQRLWYISRRSRKKREILEKICKHNLWYLQESQIENYKEMTLDNQWNLNPKSSY